MSELPPKTTLLLEAARFKVWQHEIPTAEGIRRRQTIDHPGSSVILPLLPPSEGERSPRIVLIRNQRIAVGQQLIELPAGTLEPPEPPIENAKRELIEETGYRAGKIEPLTELWMSPGILKERSYGFLATDLTAGEPAREAGEEIENVIVPLDAALTMIRNGEIVDAKTVAMLLHYQTFGASAVS